MTDDQLSTLSQELRARLKGKCASDEALYMDLFAAFVQLVASDEEPCEEYAMFERDSEANYAYGDAPESHLFSEGVYWCAARLRKEIMAMKTKAVRAHVVREVTKRHRGLLVAIKDNPGITQQELASKLQKSKSNLAQILSRLEPHHLFIVIPDGRYKKYRISSAGLTVLKEIGSGHAACEPNRYRKTGTNVPHGMEEMKVVAILASNERRNAVIDMRPFGYSVNVPSSMARGIAADNNGPSHRRPVTRKAGDHPQQLQVSASDTSLVTGITNHYDKHRL